MLSMKACTSVPGFIGIAIGFGGAFAVKFPEVSGALVQEKVDCAAGSGADVLLVVKGDDLLESNTAYAQGGIIAQKLLVAFTTTYYAELAFMELRGS